ncbi:hypothetical protein K6U06_00780 [Acidiferrimicrobium sp. IK]|uniref:hypothetical protein n=1 Tax=Acidiferrimicrobium sp. IK TaxID=2871700 RepID=UPI0021CB5B2D|nr:hypothetical protein [Acidiferrimicrobium sp. IK]MCU4182881.1 hypothetical protein [Acidiferrimicrobium sp. IK]
MTIAAPPSLKVREDLVVAGLRAAVADDHTKRYLVLALPGRTGPCWVCAPATDTALAAVRDGRTSPWAVVHHSATGTVDIYRTMLDGSLRESVVLCANLPLGDTLLSAA